VPLLSIGEARAAANGTHLRVRGVVTAQSGLLEAGSAVVQDSTGAILVRLASSVGGLALREFVELDGTRSTKAGMLSLRVTKPPLRLGAQSDPEPIRRATGALGEVDEARLVIARGAVSTAVSRSRSGAVSFAIDDGSGPIRVTISPRSGIAGAAIRRGAWLELRGALGQETTAKAPLKGYRLWPRALVDLRLIAAPPAAASATTTCCAAVAQATVHLPPSGQLPDSVLGDVVLPVPGISPSLAHPNPTGSPTLVMTAVGHGATPPDRAPRAAGLVVSGMGLVALVGLAAWFGRRRRHGEEWPSAEIARSEVDTEAAQASPHLSLVRVPPADAQEERRILPPT
jgi:DNA/RNA endonuclease YhcR with UshA esterase domain